MLKILHCADIHLDSPFKSGNAGKSNVRRRELRESFSSMMEYIKNNGIELVLIAGDLFDTGYVMKDTADFVVKELADAAPCKFVISPGNHDPYTEDSVYSKMAFSDNVYIFNSATFDKFSFPELNVDVYGHAFVKNKLEVNPFAGKTPDNSERINLLCAHAEVGDPLSPFCPVSEADIAATGLDYCAFGHIHNFDGLKKAGNTYYAYCGCLEGRDFGETGYKGAIYLEISKELSLASVKASKIRFSKRRYEIYPLDVSGCSENASLVQKINATIAETDFGYDTLLRIVLTGNVSPSLKIDTEILQESLSQNFFYIEVENHTLPLYDAETLENDPTIRGAFFKELRPLLENGSEEDRVRAARALRIGLTALSGEDIE